MRQPALDFDPTRNSSLLKRIRENLESVWMTRRVTMARTEAFDGVPIHLLEPRREQMELSAQAGSTLLHGLFFAALLYATIHPISKMPANSVEIPFPPGKLTYAAPRQIPAAETYSLGKRGSGGGHNPLPPTTGELARLSTSAFAAPRLPGSRPHPLPVPATVFDANAPELAAPVKNLGLPWMKNPNNSEGTGTAGIGNGPGSTMGDRDGNGSGVGNSLLPYAGVAAPVICKYCPDPAYSDEARKAKMQGRVTMRVLVGADGRAKDVQVTSGIGLGLDENAVRAVRSWQFIPARDVERRPVASWITIETVFRLF
ncbi:MAG TPA: TonB family protein [Candidatus Acidoferrum sp.]|jgi:protein TonB